MLKYLAPRARGVRIIASAAQVMAWVGAGTLQGYMSWSLAPYDVAAGTVIVREAGGEVLRHDGEDATIFDRDIIVSCGGGLSEDLRDACRYANRRRPLQGLSLFSSKKMS